MVENIVFFDGFCNFCSSTANFIIKRDRKSYFHFSALQSETASVLLQNTEHPVNLESIVLFEKGKYYFYSTAALRIACKLSFPWNLFYVFILIPPFLRDPAYKWFASKRYKWFGRREVCFVPDDKDKARFEITKR
jgi:predicted DCC family thiol-disulfide oxidoreductase YuxK